MGNIYTRPDGIRVMEVEYGWGMELEAIEFPLELATKGRCIAHKVLENMDKFKGKINTPSVLDLLSYCNDVMDNAQNGESTFVIDVFFKNEIETMSNLISKLSKIQTC